MSAAHRCKFTGLDLTKPSLASLAHFEIEAFGVLTEKNQRPGHEGQHNLDVLPYRISGRSATGEAMVAAVLVTGCPTASSIRAPRFDRRGRRCGLKRRIGYEACVLSTPEGAEHEIESMAREFDRSGCGRRASTRGACRR
ncbi:MAG: hypothetical protein M3Z31_19515 [Pseudomonadota bacterium]|nr:hypothetical protein [Pseudomonadota bacterium]